MVYIENLSLATLFPISTNVMTKVSGDYHEDIFAPESLQINQRGRKSL
jgi:hypothetical protein